MTGGEIRERSLRLGQRVVHCPCYGGLCRVPGSGVGPCPNEDCPTRAAGPTSPDVIVLLVREDGGYEITLPDWGYIGEVTRWGYVESLPRPDAIGVREIEGVAAELFAVPRRTRERAVGYHYDHPLAIRLARCARALRTLASAGAP